MRCCCPLRRFCPNPWPRWRLIRWGRNRRLGHLHQLLPTCVIWQPSAVPPGMMLLGPAWSEGRPWLHWADALQPAVCDDGRRDWGRPLPPAAEPRRTGRRMRTAAVLHRRAHGGAEAETRRSRPLGRAVPAGRHRPTARLSAGSHWATGREWWRAGRRLTDRGRSLGRWPTAAIGGVCWPRWPAARLGFGTVAAGTMVPALGFSGRIAGVADAADITHLGGWRALAAIWRLTMDEAGVGRPDRCRKTAMLGIDMKARVAGSSAHASDDLVGPTRRRC